MYFIADMHPKWYNDEYVTKVTNKNNDCKLNWIESWHMKTWFRICVISEIDPTCTKYVKAQGDDIKEVCDSNVRANTKRQIASYSSIILRCQAPIKSLMKWRAHKENIAIHKTRICHLYDFSIMCFIKWMVLQICDILNTWRRIQLLNVPKRNLLVTSRLRI